MKLHMCKWGAVMVLSLAYTAAQAQEKSVNSSDLVGLYRTSEMITFQPLTEQASYDVRVRGPEGFVFSKTFSGQHTPFIDAYDNDGYILKDGLYAFEIRGIPLISEEMKLAMISARATGNYSDINFPKGQLAQSGYFRISNGFFIVNQEKEKAHISAKDTPDLESNTWAGSKIAEKKENTEGQRESDDEGSVTLDSVISDNLIIDGSACVGERCATGESFGADTLRLKEYNLRIRAVDTSVGTFPSNDWQLTFNESSDGGADKFSIEDLNSDRTIFTLEAGAPPNSLYVDNGGRVGLGTATPVVELHAVSSESPTIRLEQDGSAGFTSQTWDIACNDAGFFVSDINNGGTQPFRILPGASSDALVINGNDEIGIGAGTSPAAKFHIENTGGQDTDDFVVTSSGKVGLGTTSVPDFAMLEIASGNNDTSILLNDTSRVGTNGQYRIGSTFGIFLINKEHTANTEFTLDASGNVVISGSVTAPTLIGTNINAIISMNSPVYNVISDSNTKENFVSLNPGDILDRVLALPLSEWSFKEDKTKERHFGPMAQDFYAGFGLGTSNRTINIADATGVAFGAIQGLNQVIKEKNNEIKSMKTQLDALTRRLEKLEQEK